MIDTLFIDLDGTLISNKLKSTTLYSDLALKYFNNKNLGEKIKISLRKHCSHTFKTLPHTDFLKDIGWGYDWDNMFHTDFSGKDLRLNDLKNVAEEYQHFVLGLLLNEYGKSEHDHALIESVIAFMKEKWLEHYSPYSDTHAFLNKCKHYKKYILTNGLEDIQMKKIYHCDLYDSIDGVFISGAYGIGKPATSYYENVINCIGVDKKSVVMIGDTWSTDIIGAANAGIKTIWKKSHNKVNDKREVDLFAAIDNLIEIPDLLLSYE